MLNIIEFAEWPNDLKDILHIQGFGEKRFANINGVQHSYMNYKGKNYLHLKNKKEPPK